MRTCHAVAAAAAIVLLALLPAARALAAQDAPRVSAPWSDPHWLDYGTDDYAGSTFSGTAPGDSRTLFLGWMSNWRYALRVPTSPWRGTMTLPRELALVRAAALDPTIGAEQSAPMALDATGMVDVHAFVDRGAIELYLDHGRTVITALELAGQVLDHVSVEADDSVRIESARLYGLSSIWH